MATRASKWLSLALLGALTLSPLTAFAEDSIAPSDVTNLAGTPGDEQAILEWDPATDDTSVDGYYVYYGLDSVPAEADDYIGSEDAGDSTSYTMENLTNGMTYYFAVVAYDDAGNLSTEYSNEVEITPEVAETGDFTAPTVLGAEAISSTLVEVEFSESVLEPVAADEAFTIVGTDGGTLEVLDASLSNDPAVMVLVTTEQTGGTSYVLTAGITIEDEAENPIVSGTSDTAIFIGSSEAAEIVEDEEEDHDHEDHEDHEHEDEEHEELNREEDEEFEITDVESTDLTEILVEFSGDASEIGPEHFTLQLSDDVEVELDVLAVSTESEDELLLLTEDMEAGADYILTMESFNQSFEFEAQTLELADLIAPEDVTDFLAGIAGENSVMLSWTASVDSAGDLAEYIVYLSTDGNIFRESKRVSNNDTQYEWGGLEAGETYTFKITAMDENGNESEGQISTVTLPEAGPGMVAMGAISLLGAGVIARRRRED